MKRFIPAAAALALAVFASSAQAVPYFGFDGRSYGESLAPDFGHAKGGGDRRHLTAAIRKVLDEIESRFGPVDVISGYRPGATIAGSGRVSRHASGNAVDIDAGSRKKAIVKWLVANHRNGGTMTYSGMSHIHVDVGAHFVALANPSDAGGAVATRVRSRGSSRNAEYAARAYAREVPEYARRGSRRDDLEYASRYDDEPVRAQRSRYARDDDGYRGGYEPGLSHGARYASGYATIYN